MKFIASPFCIPSIPVTTEKVGCIDKDGKKNHILILTIPASPDLHTNHQDDAYYRMGDKSHKLSFSERMQMLYAKGSRYYEDEPTGLRYSQRLEIMNSPIIRHPNKRSFSKEAK